MSKQIELALRDSGEDEDGEEYFATNPMQSSISPRRPSSRNRGKNRSREAYPSQDTENKLDDEEEQPGHHAPNIQLDSTDWFGQDHTEHPDTPITAYINAFFMTIATVLGTGILGLPVKLSRTGFAPLLVTYTIIFVMQIALVIYVVEILQRARIEYQKKQITEAERVDGIPLVQVDREHASEDDDTEEISVVDIDLEESLGESPSKPQVSLSKGEDLHSLAQTYLNWWMRKLFDVGITLHFLSLLITYTLAASEAYGQLFGLHRHWIWLAIPFVGILAPTVVLGSRWLDPVISVFTFSKAGLLILMVAITAVASSNVKQEISTDWHFIGKPILIGTVALGGCYNILPVAFEKVRFHTRQVQIFTACAVAGLTLVYVFNLAWCYFVLRIVPQMPDGSEEFDSVYTLHDAEKQGQISTVPLVNIIKKDHPKYRWIATVVMLFTMVSITVSFVVNSMAWKHYVEGLVAIWTPTRESVTTPFARFLVALRNIHINWKRTILFTVSFSFVLAVAMFNPKGFLKIMEKVTSMAANGTAAAICWIIHKSRIISPSLIPWTLPNWLFQSRWIVMAFFILAMLYNLVSTILGAAGAEWA